MNPTLHARRASIYLRRRPKSAMPASAHVPEVPPAPPPPEMPELDVPSPQAPPPEDPIPVRDPPAMPPPVARARRASGAPIGPISGP